MKHLTLVRHAKSSWKDEGLSDHDRPLNKRGKHDAPLMGERLRELGIRPDLLVSSSAKRARTTAKAIAKAIGYPIEDIVLEPRLYLAEVDELMAVIRGLGDEHRHIMLFGHNPGFTALANRLGATRLENLPTCGVYGVELDAERWREVADAPGRLRFYDYPKRHESEA